MQNEDSWFREEWAERPGEETLGCTVAARGKRRSRPLPTKAIDEAVGERGSGRYPLGDLARVGCCVQCRADALVLRNRQLGLAGNGHGVLPTAA